MVNPEPARDQGIAGYLHNSLQLILDPSDSKGLAIFNKHTLLRIAQILYQ